MAFYCFAKLERKGQAFVLFYMVVSVFLILSAALFSKAFSEKNIALRNKLSREAFYLAEGGTENAIAVFASQIANYQISPTIDNYNITTSFTTFSGAVVNSIIDSLEGSDRLVLEDQTNIWVRNYEITSTVTHPENSGISVTLHQIVARRLIPTFQHAVFYDQDLEMLPGPDMTLSGRIHSNQDIYLDSHNTLTVDSTYLRSAGDFYNERKDDGSTLGGDVSILVDQGGAPQYEDMDNLDSNSPNWTTESQNRWQGTVQSDVHGVTELTAPAVASIQPGGYYNSNANVVIINDVITKNGVPLVEGTDYPAGTITMTQTTYNNRENKFVKMTNIDLEKLAGYLPGDPPGFPTFQDNIPSNGLLYATRNDSAGATQPGIRLQNAEEIHRNSGLTVVSNDPVYIQGNFNTENKKPASVICDAMNLLSNNWDDSNSTSGLNSRVASVTTYNCAFIAGIDVTTPGNYNGGLENYPRMHEKWTNRNLNIRGSFVALWNSLVATGAWHYGNPQYTAPRRNWDYDTDFNDPSKLPPFTPWAVDMRRVAWWQE